MKISAVLFLTLLAVVYQVNAGVVKPEGKVPVRAKLPELELPSAAANVGADETEQEQVEETAEETQSSLYKIPGAKIADYLVGTAIEGGKDIGEAVGDGIITTIDTAQKLGKPAADIASATIGRIPVAGQIATGAIDFFDNLFNSKKEFIRNVSRRNNQAAKQRGLSNLFSL